MRVLVTGADGFVGKHLCAFLRESGDDVVEMHGPGTSPNAVDMLDVTRLRAFVANAAPTAVVHLAGVSFVGESHEKPGHTFEVNAVGAVHLLDCIRREAPGARVLLVGSGEMYGPTANGERATEDQALRPTSPYSSSKVAAEVAGFQFFRSYGLQVVSARSFNHLGPGQGARFVVPSFAKQLRDIKAKRVPPKLVVGDLAPIRDFSHVSDVVSAYRLLLERGTAGEAYNIASGTGRSIRSILDELLTLAAVDVVPEVDPTRFRPAELPRLVGDPSKIRVLGWASKKTVSDALREALYGDAL